jgi:hypothetical protein
MSREIVEWIERETIRRALNAAPAERPAAGVIDVRPFALSFHLARYPRVDRRKTESATDDNTADWRAAFPRI